MNIDFTLRAYRSLVEALKKAEYQFFTFEDYCRGARAEKFVILRHDVDEIAPNALKIATIEHSLGIRATYFFRIVRQSNRPEIIKAIAALGHEIGYHYEDLSIHNGDFDKAIASFKTHLEYFRQYYPIKTVCMHGSSSSKHDNRLLWQHYNLTDYGLLGEPYISLDFSKIYYLTDTGYAWDGGKYAIRDVVENSTGLSFHTTAQIVDAINSGTFPQQLMILAHTLWTDSPTQWTMLHLREFIRNNIKYLAMRSKWLNKLYSKMVRAYWKGR